MFEPITYCACGNTREYDVWQIQPLVVKKAIQNCLSIKKTAVCPVCRCLEVMNKTIIALKSF